MNHASRRMGEPVENNANENSKESDSDDGDLLGFVELDLEDDVEVSDIEDKLTLKLLQR